jgi:hypothetical protein
VAGKYDDCVAHQQHTYGPQVSSAEGDAKKHAKWLRVAAKELMKRGKNFFRELPHGAEAELVAAATAMHARMDHLAMWRCPDIVAADGSVLLTTVRQDAATGLAAGEKDSSASDSYTDDDGDFTFGGAGHVRKQLLHCLKMTTSTAYRAWWQTEPWVRPKLTKKPLTSKQLSEHRRICIKGYVPPKNGLQRHNRNWAFCAKHAGHSGPCSRTMDIFTPAGCQPLDTWGVDDSNKAALARGLAAVQGKAGREMTRDGMRRPQGTTCIALEKEGARGVGAARGAVAEATGKVGAANANLGVARAPGDDDDTIEAAEATLRAAEATLAASEATLRAAEAALAAVTRSRCPACGKGRPCTRMPDVERAIGEKEGREAEAGRKRAARLTGNPVGLTRHAAEVGERKRATKEAGDAVKAARGGGEGFIKALRVYLETIAAEIPLSPSIDHVAVFLSNEHLDAAYAHLRRLPVQVREGLLGALAQRHGGEVLEVFTGGAGPSSSSSAPSMLVSSSSSSSSSSSASSSASSLAPSLAPSRPAPSSLLILDIAGRAVGCVGATQRGPMLARLLRLAVSVVPQIATSSPWAHRFFSEALTRAVKGANARLTPAEWDAHDLGDSAGALAGGGTVTALCLLCHFLAAAPVEECAPMLAKLLQLAASLVPRMEASSGSHLECVSLTMARAVSATGRLASSEWDAHALGDSVDALAGRGTVTALRLLRQFLVAAPVSAELVVATAMVVSGCEVLEQLPLDDLAEAAVDAIGRGVTAVRISAPSPSPSSDADAALMGTAVGALVALLDGTALGNQHQRTAVVLRILAGAIERCPPSSLPLAVSCLLRGASGHVKLLSVEDDATSLAVVVTSIRRAVVSASARTIRQIGGGAAAVGVGGGWDGGRESKSDEATGASGGGAADAVVNGDDGLWGVAAMGGPTEVAALDIISFCLRDQRDALVFCRRLHLPDSEESAIHAVAVSMGEEGEEGEEGGEAHSVGVIASAERFVEGAGGGAGGGATIAVAALLVKPLCSAALATDDSTQLSRIASTLDRICAMLLRSPSSSLTPLTATQFVEGSRTLRVAAGASSASDFAGRGDLLFRISAMLSVVLAKLCGALVQCGDHHLHEILESALAHGQETILQWDRSDTGGGTTSAQHRIMTLKRISTVSLRGLTSVHGCSGRFGNYRYTVQRLAAYAQVGGASNV